jgi:hypothetical protein
MRYQNVMVTIGVIIAGFQAWMMWRGPQPTDPPAVQTAIETVVRHPIGGLVLVATLFVIAGLLSAAPLLARLLPQKKSSSNADGANGAEGRERQFFICSNGYPLRGLQSAIQLDVQILSTVQTKIVYAKATLSRPEGYHGKTSWIDIENHEPHTLAPMQMFNLPMTKKDMQQEDVSRFLGPNTAIQGFIKVEKGGGYEELQIPSFATYREWPKEPQVKQPQNLKQRTIQLADELFGLLRELGPEPPHALSDKSGTVAGQQQTFDAYFEWQRKAYHSYMARFKDRVVQIDNELAAVKISTKLDDREIDPPKNNGQVQLKKISETLLVTAYHMPN